MNAPIVVQALRLGFLLVLWIFVFILLRVVRKDIFGTAPQRQPPAGRPMAAPPRPAGGPAPPPDREPRQLVVTAGSHQGTRIPLGGQAITIGRSEDSTLVLDDEYVSTRHARFSQRGGVWYLDDLGSTNGTFIGATRVTQPVPAPIGAPIRIGTTVLELRP